MQAIVPLVVRPADALQDLGRQVLEYRSREGLSLREAAAASGVPVATLSRIEKGRTPDLETFRRLLGWIGESPDRFFSPMERTENTPDAIAVQLRADPALPADAAERIAGIVRDLYDNLAMPERRLAVHLRAAKTFTPPALKLFTDVLEELREALETSTVE